MCVCLSLSRVRTSIGIYVERESEMYLHISIYRETGGYASTHTKFNNIGNSSPVEMPALVSPPHLVLLLVLGSWGSACLHYRTAFLFPRLSRSVIGAVTVLRIYICTMEQNGRVHSLN